MTWRADWHRLRLDLVAIAAVPPVVVAIVLLLTTCGQPTSRDPVQPDPALTRVLDSLRRSEAAVRAELDALNARASTAERLATEHRLDALQSRQRADSLERLAAQLAAAAARDSTPTAAAQWRAAYEARTAEADTLRHLLLTQEREIVQLRTSLVAWRDAAQVAEARMATLDRVTADLANERDRLAREIARRQRADRCLLGLIPCPTRTAAFTAGAVAGATVTVAAVVALAR